MSAPNRNPDYLKMPDLVERALYRLDCRNLSVGVWDAKSRGFIGIRTKFGSRFLFIEYHWDTGEPYGTVCPVARIGLELLPSGIPLKEYLGSADYAGKAVEFKPDDPVKGGIGWWYYVDDHTPVPKDVRFGVQENRLLFDWLDARTPAGDGRALPPPEKP